MFCMFVHEVFAICILLGFATDNDIHYDVNIIKHWTSQCKLESSSVCKNYRFLVYFFV